MIKYNHLVANMIILHNVVGMTRVLQELLRCFLSWPMHPEGVVQHPIGSSTVPDDGGYGTSSAHALSHEASASLSLIPNASNMALPR